MLYTFLYTHSDVCKNDRIKVEEYKHVDTCTSNRKAMVTIVVLRIVTYTSASVAHVDYVK